MKTNFTAPLEGPGDTLECQIKKLGIAVLKHIRSSWAPQKDETKKHQHAGGRQRENQGKQRDYEALCGGRREGRKEGGLY